MLFFFSFPGRSTGRLFHLPSEFFLEGKLTKGWEHSHTLSLGLLDFFNSHSWPLRLRFLLVLFLVVASASEHLTAKSCDPLYPPTCPSNFQGSSLLSRICEELLMLFVQRFSCCRDGSGDFQAPSMSD